MAKRNRIWAVSFERLAQDGQPDTLHVKARGAEEAIRRAILDAIDTNDGICPDAPDYLTSAGITAERLVVVSAMAGIWDGSLPVTAEQIAEMDGEDGSPSEDDS